MDLKYFKFPELTGLDMAFSDLDADPKLLAEAKGRGFFDFPNPYCQLFDSLFFSGGKLDFKDGLDPDFKAKAVPYLRAFMGSFAPKHEHKQAICALLLSELVSLPCQA